VNNELGGMWKESVVVQLKVLPRHLSGGAEDTPSISLPGKLVFGPRFEAGTSRLHSRCTDYSTSTARSG
jgi:hypothetical protein